jgi:ATP-dependent Clp protease protease subunit
MTMKKRHQLQSVVNGPPATTTVEKFWNMSKSSEIVAGKTKNTAQINIHGVIGSSWWDESVSASQFSKDLKDLGDDVDEITVSLNSAGGSVFDGLAIRSFLKNHKAWVIMRVEGWAASIASIIMTAGDEIIICLGGQVMIHEPMNQVFGTSAVFRKQADILDKIRDSLIEVYQSKTNLDKETLIKMMEVETWMNADEAVADGFADRIEANTAVDLSMMGAVAMVNNVQFDTNWFKNAPKIPQNTAIVPPATPIIPAVDIVNVQNKEDEPIMNEDELKAKYPELYNQVMESGRTSERERINGLNALASAPGAATFVADAIQNGGNAAEVAMKIVNASIARVTTEGASRAQDATDSNVNAVATEEAANPKVLTAEQEAAKETEMVNAMAAEMKNLADKKGGRN